MLRKVLEFGSVLEHVCQVWVHKVVDLDVISGRFLGWFLEVALGVSWRSNWESLGRHRVVFRAVLKVELEFVYERYVGMTLIFGHSCGKQK